MGNKAQQKVCEARWNAVALCWRIFKLEFNLLCTLFS